MARTAFAVRAVLISKPRLATAVFVSYARPPLLSSSVELCHTAAKPSLNSFLRESPHHVHPRSLLVERENRPRHRRSGTVVRIESVGRPGRGRGESHHGEPVAGTESGV